MHTQTDTREAHRQLQLDLNQQNREEWIEDCRKRILGDMIKKALK